MRPGGIGVDQRSGAVEILRIAQDMEDFGGDVVGLGARKQRAGGAGFRIGFLSIGEWEHVDRKMDIEEFFGVARGLRKAVIERSTACAADFVDDSVKDRTALFVAVEAFI